MNANCFQGRRVLVTGGLGFIGSNLCLRLLDMGAEVTVINRSIPCDPSGQISELRSHADVIVADVRDEQTITAAVRGKDVIFDLAGTSGAVQSNTVPLLDLEDNCRAHLTLLEACRTVNPQVTFVFPSTRLVYGRPERLPVDEHHPLAPASIYAVHKLAVENYIQIYARRCGLKATVLRISNPFGPLQSLEARSYGLANRFIQAAARGEKITVFGDGGQLRDYLYIDDLVDVLLRSCCSRKSANTIYNIGSGVGTSVHELAEMAIAAAGRGEIECVPWPPDYQTVETGDYLTDISLAERELGWRPMVDVSAGIDRTVEFYRPLAARPLESGRT